MPNQWNIDDTNISQRQHINKTGYYRYIDTGCMLFIILSEVEYSA